MSEVHGPATIAAGLTTATAALTPGSETPRLDAEVLLAHVLGVDRARLVLDHQSELEGEAMATFDRLIERRASGEPVAYLIGHRPFRALELSVDPRVLIPRPETEGLVEAATAALADGASVLDVGTGSGAIALALASERPDLRIRGADVSPEAIAVARQNATALDLRVSFSVGDLLDGSDPVDAVIANLPYVERDADLPVDVAGFEPGLALYGGEDGLAVIRRLVDQLAEREWPAWVVLEIGESHGAAVSGLLRAAGFDAVEVRPDLSGRDRMVFGTRVGRVEGPDGRGRGLHPRPPTGPRPAMTSSEAETFERCMSVGGVAVFPSDTVYGLACDPGNRGAVERLYALKRRALDKPSAVMFFDRELALEALPELGPRTVAALVRLLPGPVSLLLPNPAARFPLACGGDPGTLGLRVVDVPALSGVRWPVLQSSANHAGGPDARTLAEVPAEIRRRCEMVIDGGELPGTPSTVIDLRAYERERRWGIMRVGGLDSESARQALEEE